MYQNLLALHSVDACNQGVISVEDIYEITDSLDSLSVGKPQNKSRTAQEPEEAPDYNGHHKKAQCKLMIKIRIVF